ncbi:hypothetical protein RYZ26_15425 [Terasakiella sp. A23]|uniref:hypothetical protein n=1 Tax=Terasakiella sp. FCG-A23 TaxID=3080561 RepID=UPI002954CAFC|nr:hypothetical protein [Terasakiella sp. A23]MDV7340996.1 hypothetical protein [Terasakiella sp. A23]
MKIETNPLVHQARMKIILMEHGMEITAEDFCKEHIRRGWAFPDLTPASLGLEPTDIIRYTPTLN